MQKCSIFSWRHPFQTIESAERAFDTRAGLGKPALLHALFLKDKKTKQQKKL